MSHNLRIITVAQPIPGVIKVVPVDGTNSRPKTLRGKRSCFFSHMDTVRECTRIWRPFGTRWPNALRLNVKISTVPTDQHITTQAPQSLGETLRAWIKEFIQFGLVGATAFVIDMGLFNLFQHGPLGFLSGHVNTANALAASIATIYSWIMNRVWTYRGRTQENAGREAFLFFFANVCGIGITQFCLLFTHHILGLNSPLADNISAYVVGFALGTAFRFIFYHYVVFTGTKNR